MSIARMQGTQCVSPYASSSLRAGSTSSADTPADEEHALRHLESFRGYVESMNNRLTSYIAVRNVDVLCSCSGILKMDPEQMDASVNVLQRTVYKLMSKVWEHKVTKTL